MIDDIVALGYRISVEMRKFLVKTTKEIFRVYQNHLLAVNYEAIYVRTPSTSSVVRFYKPSDNMSVLATVASSPTD
jgi:hypothetical protein